MALNIVLCRVPPLVVNISLPVFIALNVELSHFFILPILLTTIFDLICELRVLLSYFYLLLQS